MSDLKSTERIKLESLFEMESGYVLNFTNRTFRAFVLHSTSADIYDSKYLYGSGSKANRLRAFWNTESNHMVAKLLLALLEYWKTLKLARYSRISHSEQTLFDECCKISDRLKHESIGEHIDAIQPNIDDRDFTLLSKAIRDSIEQGEPEAALDRLHTFVVRYIRELCAKRNINESREKPLHSLFGEYVKYLKNNDLIESPMTERILKSSISVLEAFNDVRNNQSFAHDNPILNYDESMLIFKNISSIIHFIETIDPIQSGSEQPGNDSDTKWDDLPF